MTPKPIAIPPRHAKTKIGSSNFLCQDVINSQGATQPDASDRQIILPTAFFQRFPSAVRNNAAFLSISLSFLTAVVARFSKATKRGLCSCWKLMNCEVM